MSAPSNLHLLADAAINECYFTAFRSWRETIKHLIRLYGPISVKDILRVTKTHQKGWLTRGKYGGKTVRNTIYAACSTGVKNKHWRVVKRNSISYYYME